MKKMLSLILTISLVALLSSCGTQGRYVSAYTAMGLVKSNTKSSCEASFQSLKGRLVFKLKAPDSPSEGDISYSIESNDGEIALYYDIYGTKEALAKVSSGESVESSGGYVEAGKTVYIIIEATEKAKGKVAVNLDN